MQSIFIWSIMKIEMEYTHRTITLIHRSHSLQSLQSLIRIKVRIPEEPITIMAVATLRLADMVIQHQHRIIL